MWGATYLSSSILELLIFTSTVISAYCIGWLIGSINERSRLEKLEEEAKELDVTQEIFNYSHLKNTMAKRKYSEIYYPEILKEEE